MSRYSCREETYSLKIPPAGKTVREAFCPGCPSRPYKGENCLFGHSGQTRILICQVAAARTRLLARMQAEEDGNFCPICGEPMMGEKSIACMRCWGKVLTIERQRRKIGFDVDRAAIVEELAAEQLT